MRILSMIALVVLMASCGMQEEKVSDFEKLTTMMQGSYNSYAQSVADSANFYNISLHMYPIWEGKEEGVQYLYVEQALNSMQDKPYRQRIYRVEEIEEGVFSSAVYTFPNPEEAVFKWKTPEYFNKYTPEDLIAREGCAVILKKVSDTNFTGSTVDRECKSELRGATWASSIVSVYPDRIESWDQGFNDAGEQVWGAVISGYVFDKLK